MRIGILGPLEVSAKTDDQQERPVDIAGYRLRVLLILLALEAGRVVPAERLIDDLWEADPPASAPGALQSLVSRLRATLGNGRKYIESHPAGYRLALARRDVDAYDFEERAARARRLPDPAETAAGLREALALWRGPALAEVAGAPFAEGPIARLEGLRQAAVEERIEAELRLGRHAEVIPELEALSAADPLREPLRGRLMRALYGVGRQADALAVYEDTQRLLADRLGVDPSAELEAVYLSVLRRDPQLPTVRPAVAVPAVPGAPDEPRTNLRAQLTSFIGRDTDLTRVGKLLEDGRLVTLTGPGGAGKTRLSAEAGRLLLDRCPDGVWLVELAPVSDPAEVAHAVLTVLGLREAVIPAGTRGPVGPEPAAPLDRLAAALTHKRLLLILDNCEHLIEAAALLADRLLADCPAVRILTTSREPLGITGESLWPVEPLGLPPTGAGVQEVLGFAAARLLADRAAAVRPGFEVTSDNVADVVRICQALDGIPLAIELAAARLRALPPAQIASRLDDRFRLLTVGSRTALPRHQTLRAVVEWSWELLDDRERLLWRRFSVFAGGATVDSVQSVCGADLDVLTALVDKSLVVVTGGGRFRMLETIRAYGRERLAEAGEVDRVRRAHAEYFLAMAEAAEPQLRGRGQIQGLERLAADHDNLHGALRCAVSAGDAVLGVRLCAALGWYWWLRGHRAEGSEAAAQVLRLPDLPDDQTTAMAYALAATVASFGGPHDSDEIMSWLHRCREIVDALPGESLHPLLHLIGPIFDLVHTGGNGGALADLAGLFDHPDVWLRGMAHFFYGQVTINAGGPQEAGEHFEIALSSFRSVGDRWGTAFCLAAQGEIVTCRGEYPHAIALYEESLACLQELGTAEDAPHVYMRLANGLWLQGQRERARELIAQARRIAERTGAPENLAAVQFQLGDFARRDGRMAEARVRLDRALELASGIGGPAQFKAVIKSARGSLHVAEGELGAARPRLEAALADAVASRDAPVIALVVAAFADLRLSLGDSEQAAVLLGAADGIRGGPDLSLPDVLRTAEAARAALGDSFTTRYDRGRALAVDDVLALLAREP